MSQGLPDQPGVDWGQARDETLRNLQGFGQAIRALLQGLSAYVPSSITRAQTFLSEGRYPEAIEAFAQVGKDVEKLLDRRIRLDAWRRLSARTAHRIDSQVFAAKGALRNLETHLGPEAAEASNDIQEALGRIGHICMEFRRFSTDRPPRLGSTQVGLILEDAVRRYAKSAEGTEMTVELPAALPECNWDPQQIDQAISELLENAIHHTPRGGRIVTTAGATDRDGKPCIMIAVTNDGQGIRPEHKDRVFEPFFTTRPGGTGLGLAIVRQIIENHGGWIRETGEPGKSTRFEIEIPVNAEGKGQDASPGD
jgi:signal transduction histidine kinase